MPAYAVDEAAIVGVDIIPSNADMSNGIFRYASVDLVPQTEELIFTGRRPGPVVV